MKISKLYIVILGILVTFGCTKEKDTPAPAPVPAPTSTCPTGYTGTNCATQITPSKIRITKVTVVKFPQFDGGSNWDIADIGDSRPELFVQFSRGSSVLFSTGYFQDANYNQSYYWDAINTPTIFPYDILIPTSQHTISAYDYDTGTNDFIGGFNFTPYSSSGGFPSTLVIQNGGSLEFRLDVTYIF
jgi:hypothetical protein